jgi:hypothetical protein
LVDFLFPLRTNYSAPQPTRWAFSKNTQGVTDARY